MSRLAALVPLAALASVAFAQPIAPPRPLDVTPKPVASDPAVVIDYDIVYVRMPRKGDAVGTSWAEIANPTYSDPGADLMLLHPDGTEEVLVAGGKGAVTDPVISFDGAWVYYALFHDLTGGTATQGPPAGADIYKLNLKSRETVRLTTQTFTPNLGAADWSPDFRTPAPGKNSLPYGVFNLGPCPLPGGKVMFASNRNAFRPPKRLPHVMQLFVMDDDGANLECVGHLNLGSALHPTVLRDGRVMFSSLESQGMRHSILWGLWTIHPDGTNWGPMVSAFMPGPNPTAYHFQTQLTDGRVVAEEYYNQTSSGFGSLVVFPPGPPAGEAPFGPGYADDPRNPPLPHGRVTDTQPRIRRFPFSPVGIESLTRFARADEGPADFASGPNTPRRTGPRVGKVTHPSAAPRNHLLLSWSSGPVNGGYTVHVPAVDSGIYLLKDGKAVDEPGQLLKIKDDPRYNEHWPRAVVPYKAVHGVAEPVRLPTLANDGKLSKHLPAGTPFGLVGTSSFYKRESYPNGIVKGVTAAFAGGPDRAGYADLDPFNTTEAASGNWFNQGADAGRYTNADIHAVRILMTEPATDRPAGPHNGRTFRSHATERLRILGEIPVRKFTGTPPPEGEGRKTEAGSPSPPFLPREGGPGGLGSSQPLDPDGNPDTSFLAKIPADVGFTFQTLDRHGMVLNMAQTWHQVRPGEIRTDCGGCHAHSQAPTLFEKTAAARPDYAVFDLTRGAPLLTTRANDTSGRRWDVKNETGLKTAAGVGDVEYFRDVKPILDRSCAACHTAKDGRPAGNLVLDDNKTVNLPDNDDVPGTYYRLAMDAAARFGHKPVIGSWRPPNASRYVRMFQSRRSLLVWKVFGRRLDGWTNDDFPTETEPGNPRTLRLKGEPVENTAVNRNRADLDFVGSAMPPPEAVAAGKVKALTDEDRFTLVRWIDLGCPIDLDYDPKQPQRAGRGWMQDDQRPTLTVAVPRAGANLPLTRLLIGAHDTGGLDPAGSTVVADFPVNGVPPGENLARRFRPSGEGEWELPLAAPLTVRRGVLT
ncbi:MAG TPA: hypothetical protein VH092_17690, partial [Urbifossiella sp.]|nr:hypothetical protein [Urbifossiella sp.]